MAELSCRLAAPNQARTLGAGTDYKQASGIFYGTQGAEPFMVPDDIDVWYDPGSGQTSDLLPAGTLAVLWGGGVGASLSGPVLSLDNLGAWYRLFTVPGAGALFYATQQDYPAIAAAQTVIPIWTVQGRVWKRSQLLRGTGPIPPPPIPPILIDSGGGGGGIVIANGSNPQQLHAGYGPKTRVLSMWFLGAGDKGGDSSYHIFPTNEAQGNWPEQPSGFPIYTDGSNGWQFWRFDAHATAGDHWPLPFSPYDAINNPTDANNVYPIWPDALKRWEHWKTPVFGLTDNHGRTSIDTIWPDHPAFPTSALDASIAPQGIWPAGTKADVIQYENVLVRGKFTLPDLGATGSVTAIDFFMANDYATVVDAITLNDQQLFLSGLTAGTDVRGDQGPFDITAQGGLFRWNADNLICLLVRGAYSDPTHGDKTSASTYISFTFTIDYGTGPYVPAPTGWQGGAFDDSAWVAEPQGDPGSFFGRGVAHSVDYGDVGVKARYYMRSHFAIPRAITAGTLAITARTGIGSIALNGVLIATLDETVDLWDSSTVLTYTLTSDQLSALHTDGSDNVLAVQAYTADGHGAIDYLLTFS